MKRQHIDPVLIAGEIIELVDQRRELLRVAEKLRRLGWVTAANQIRQDARFVLSFVDTRARMLNFPRFESSKSIRRRAERLLKAKGQPSSTPAPASARPRRSPHERAIAVATASPWVE